MATKEIQQGFMISLSAPAKAKLARLLSVAPTPQQKKSITKSKGVYSLYEKKWQKQK